MNQLDRLIDPSSIALIGASADANKLSGRPHRYLEQHGYAGEVYFVNPNRDRIGSSVCYDSVTDLPTVPELAMVLVPAPLAPGIIAECGEVGIPFAMVIASGFSEVDDNGAALEDSLVATARDGGVRLLGPNSEGILNLHADLAASFSSICKRDELIAGPVGFITQSGAFGGALFQLTQDLGIGSSAWVSTGNEADIDTLDLLELLIDDDHTETIAMYIEAVDRGRRLLELGRRAADADIDLIVIHAGTSKTGRQATASHTGSVASDQAVYEALFAQAGVTRVRGVDAFVDTVRAFTNLPSGSLPDPDGGLGIVSMSGGAAAIGADIAAEVGLPLASLDPSTVDSVDTMIPPYGSATNPLDVTGRAISDPALFGEGIEAIADDPSVSALLIQFGNSGPTVVETIMETLTGISARYAMPVCTVFTGATPPSSTIAKLEQAGVIVHEDPVGAIEVLGRLFERARAVSRLGSGPSFGPVAEGRPLPHGDVNAVIDRFGEYGIDIVETWTISDDDRDAAAIDAAERIGYPVVAKLSPTAVAHKTEVGGIKTDIDSAEALSRALDSLPPGEVIIQPQLDGVEVLVGVVEDEDFGPVVTVGPGGVLVELFDRFAHRAPPIDLDVAHEMIAETPLEHLLGGYRGLGGDTDALARFITAVSAAYVDHEVTTLEFNPVIVTDDRAVAVDVLIET